MSSSLFTNATRSSPLRRCKHRYRRGEVVRRAAADLGRDTIEAFSLLVQWFAAVCPNPAHRSTSPLRRCRHRRDELVRRAAADLPRAALEAFWLFVLWLISQFAAVYNFSSAQRRGGAKRPADDAPRSKAADKRGPRLAGLVEGVQRLVRFWPVALALAALLGLCYSAATTSDDDDSAAPAGAMFFAVVVSVFLLQRQLPVLVPVVSKLMQSQAGNSKAAKGAKPKTAKIKSCGRPSSAPRSPPGNDAVPALQRAHSSATMLDFAAA